MRLTTNCIREAMNPFDVARDVTDYMGAHGINSQSEAAEHLNLSPATISRAMGIGRIPSELRPLVDKAMHAAYIVSTLPVEKMKEVLTLTIEGNLNRDQVAKLVADLKSGKVKKSKSIKVKDKDHALSLPGNAKWGEIIGWLTKMTDAARKGEKNNLPPSALPTLL
jgi:Lhr-like helicase